MSLVADIALLVMVMIPAVVTWFVFKEWTK